MDRQGGLADLSGKVSKIIIQHVRFCISNTTSSQNIADVATFGCAAKHTVHTNNL